MARRFKIPLLPWNTRFARCFLAGPGRFLLEVAARIHYPLRKLYALRDLLKNRKLAPPETYAFWVELQRSLLRTHWDSLKKPIQKQLPKPDHQPRNLPEPESPTEHQVP